MKKYIYIIADTNDADYISNLEEITDAHLEKIMPMINAINEFQPYQWEDNDSKFSHTWIHQHNFPNSEYTRTDLGEKTIEQLYGEVSGFEEFQDLAPYGETGIHSIKVIKILTVTEELDLIK